MISHQIRCVNCHDVPCLLDVDDVHTWKNKYHEYTKQWCNKHAYVAHNRVRQVTNCLLKYTKEIFYISGFISQNAFFQYIHSSCSAIPSKLVTWWCLSSAWFTYTIKANKWLWQGLEYAEVTPPKWASGEVTAFQLSGTGLTSSPKRGIQLP